MWFRKEAACVWFFFFFFWQHSCQTVLQTDRWKERQVLSCFSLGEGAAPYLLSRMKGAGEQALGAAPALLILANREAVLGWLGLQQHYLITERQIIIRQIYMMLNCLPAKDCRCSVCACSLGARALAHASLSRWSLTSLRGGFGLGPAVGPWPPILEESSRRCFRSWRCLRLTLTHAPRELPCA